MDPKETSASWVASAKLPQPMAITREEALLDLLEEGPQAEPRPQVMALYEASVAQHATLYERLSKEG